MKVNKIFLSLAMAGSVAGVTTSCSDMLDRGNEYVIYAEDHTLTTPADTVTSVLGILNQLQAIAVRTNLYGEVRADLVKVNDNASIELKDLANFNADVLNDDESNKYNLPRDYYSVINNCNYYLAHADSTAGNTNRNEKYFVNEIAQVHSIRAWTYLQTVLAYGRIPLVTEPVVTKLQSEAQYPMVELNDICDYFINDLKPYYAHEYPDPRDIGGDADPKMCFFPTQVVTGDLYLWKAVLNRDPEMAKQAAKCYYDYIMWDLSGKKVLTMNTNAVSWSERTLDEEKYFSPNGGLTISYSTNWGRAGVEGITCIPMDSASTSGNYNELRNLYNYTYVTEVKEACISPTDYYFNLSESQDYYGWGLTRNDIVKVDRSKFEDEELEDHMYGDLRLWDGYSLSKITHNSVKYNDQYVYKHQGQHIGVYRTTQLYLRLAEALNYAGYPRFAKQLLVMGISDKGMKAEVYPYYTSAADSAFLNYFQFADNNFITMVENYTELTDSLGTVIGYDPMYRSTTDDVTMIGIHSRGSGLTFLNKNYAPAIAPDSTNYPRALAQKVGHWPVKSDYEFPTKPSAPKAPYTKLPSTWEKYPGVTLSEEEYGAKTSAVYKRYADSVAKFVDYYNVKMPAYEAELAEYDAETARVQAIFDADLEAFDARRETFMTAYNEWYKAAYSDPKLIKAEQNQVDKLLLDEQALELVFEGNRFFDLMRRAFWYNDPSRLATPISEARKDSGLKSKLMDYKNWYLKWKGQIGY